MYHWHLYFRGRTIYPAMTVQAATKLDAEAIGFSMTGHLYDADLVREAPHVA